MRSSQAVRGRCLTAFACPSCMQVAFVLAALLATGFAAEHSECTSQQLGLGHTCTGSRTRAQHRAHSSAILKHTLASFFQRLCCTPAAVSVTRMQSAACT
jgi:hypothetical protein